MSQGRHGIKILGLSLLAALGLMAFAASAQAGEYKIEGKTLTEKGLASESVSGTVTETGKLLVPGLALTIECKKAKASGTILLGGTAHATVLFEECAVEGNKFCKTFETKAKMETETEPGFIAASGLGTLVLMGGEHYLLIEAAEGAPFTKIFLTKTAKGCPLALEEPLFGSTVFKILEALVSSSTHVLDTLTQAEIEALFPTDLLNFGNQRAWLDGKPATVALSGANANRPFSAE